MTLPSLLPDLAPQPRGGASNGAPGRSAVSQPTSRLPTSPSHRVDGLQLAGASSSPPCILPACNVASVWATTSVGISDSSPPILDFMSLYDICVAINPSTQSLLAIYYQKWSLFLGGMILTVGMNYLFTWRDDLSYGEKWSLLFAPMLKTQK
jgi:hypothetical protein